MRRDRGPRGIIEAKLQQCIYERNRLERYITTIEDSLLQVSIRFVNGLPWQQVAACIGRATPLTACG
ncbi:MAG: hypothetical protein ACLSF6_03280 [Evtepia gabavorous]